MYRIATPAKAAPVWQRLETDEFTIYSKASAGDGKEFAVNYAAFRQILREVFNPAGRKPSHSTPVL